MLYNLVTRTGKVIFSSNRKIDAVYAHQAFSRRQGISLVEVATKA